MASFNHYMNETQIVWEHFNYSGTEEVDISEVWRGDEEECDAAITLHRRINKHDFSKWLNQTGETRPGFDGVIEGKCALRIIWILRDKRRRLLDVDSVLFAKICSESGQGLAQDYCNTQYAGVGSIIDETTAKRVYFLCNHPKLAVTWAHDEITNATTAICVADQHKLNILQDMVGSRFIHDLAHLKLTPALMSAVLSSKEVDMETTEVKKQVREIEARTGYHEWTSRDEISAGGDMIGLSARMSGCGIRSESNVRKLEVIEEFCQFICDHIEEEKDIKGKKELLSLTHSIRRRIALQIVDLKYTQSRTRAQKEALIDLMSANDSASAQQIAEESRQIAVAMKSDAQSMKLLAITTTIFLPGTFVAGLFSTPIFQRESGAANSDTGVKIWMPGLMLYIAISLPLLLMTLLAWGLWALRYRSKNERDLRETKKRIFLSPGYTEKEALIIRQNAMSQGDL